MLQNSNWLQTPPFLVAKHMQEGCRQQPDTVDLRVLAESPCFLQRRPSPHKSFKLVRPASGYFFISCYSIKFHLKKCPIALGKEVSTQLDDTDTDTCAFANWSSQQHSHTWPLQHQKRCSQLAHDDNTRPSKSQMRFKDLQVPAVQKHHPSQPFEDLATQQLYGSKWPQTKVVGDSTWNPVILAANLANFSQWSMGQSMTNKEWGKRLWICKWQAQVSLAILCTNVASRASSFPLHPK